MMFVRLFCQNSTFKRKPNHFFHYTALILTVFILLNNEEQREDLVIILGFQFIPTTILQCRCSTPSSHPTRSPARYLRKTQTERENTSLLTKAVPLKRTYDVWRWKRTCFDSPYTIHVTNVQEATPSFHSQHVRPPTSSRIVQYSVRYPGHLVELQ